MSWQANKKYQASIDTYGLGQTKTGTPYIWVSFLAAGCDGPCTWRGWLTSKAKPFTYKTLLRLGWNENLETPSFNKAKDFEVETELEEWTALDGTPKSRVTIKWVNDPDTATQGSTLAPEKLHLLNQSLKGDLAAIKAEEKAKTRYPVMTKEPIVSTADIPF